MFSTSLKHRSLTNFIAGCLVAGGFTIGLILSVAFGDSLASAAEPDTPKNTQPETIKLTTPQEALDSLILPEGFKATLYASEPQMTQPIAIVFDPRGRLWVAENNTYAEVTLNFDLSQKDRILIFEDSDNDGVAETHKVFWDEGRKLTSIEHGFGGVWVLAPPQLLFIPDRNHDDIPDGPPEVVLDGFDEGGIRHNIANGLRWGPDGWLYGRHGILVTSMIGPPGTPPAQRTPINCGIWRYHPTRKIFEVVCHGTTNPWGYDWNPQGELFFINTVIGHMFHAVQGAHLQRMYGEDFNPHLYELIGATSDHFHWDTAELWHDIRKLGVTPTTDQAGGGHAHSGLMIYQGNNWPEQYRGTMFTVNFHGKRLNNDHIERKGAAYVGHHAPDFLKTKDPWFRGLDLITGPDGGVYIADWSDIGECHENDGVHRSSGRIFKITYGDPQPLGIPDVSKLSNAELVAAQTHPEEWFVRQARHALQQRSAAGDSMTDVHSALRKLYEETTNPLHQLRALWSLAVNGGTDADWLISQLQHSDEYVRVWAVRLLGNEFDITPQTTAAFEQVAANETSGLVLLHLASALQRLPLADRWTIAQSLAAHAEFANDAALPLMVWYGIEPAIQESPERAVALAGTTKFPRLAKFIARRLTSNLQLVPAPVDQLVQLLGHTTEPERQLSLLQGISDGLKGWRKAPQPASWTATAESLAKLDSDEIKQYVRELSVVFGDGRAINEVLQLAGNEQAELTSRRDAIRVLVEVQAQEALPLLLNLLGDRNLNADAAAAVVAFNDPSIPAALIPRIPGYPANAQQNAIVTLSSRPAWAMLLLQSIAEKKIPRDAVPAFQIRQMSRYEDEGVRIKVQQLWPELRDIASAKRPKIDSLHQQLAGTVLQGADLKKGRKLFTKNCSNCHTLFGQGAKIGPDLTGAQRSNLTYLLENIVDPSATLSEAYRMSTVVLKSGRILNGVIADQGGTTISVQTPMEKLIIARDEIEEIGPSKLSLMPEGFLDVLSADDVRDLIGYLQVPQQIPLD